MPETTQFSDFPPQNVFHITESAEAAIFQKADAGNVEVPEKRTVLLRT